MRRLALALPLLVAGAARADELKATRGEPMFEVSHTVDVRLEDGVAICKVRRQFANPGKVADEAGLAIDLPTGAVATGLRIRAKDRWFDGELMEREKAAALYHELTGFGAYAPKDPALLQWLWADKLYLQIFPVMPGGVSTVEYTLTVPTRYSGGRYTIAYPRVAAAAASGDVAAGLPLATPIVTVHPAWGDALVPIVVDGRRAAPDTPVVLVPPVRAVWEDAIGAAAGASYVASTIAIAPSSHTTKPTDKVSVKLEVRHTYKSDLELEVLAPDGQHVKIFDRKGGGDNDVIGTFPITFPRPVAASGTWRLIASDHVGLDNGSIDHWSIAIGDTTAEATDVPIFIPDAPENGNDAGLAAISVAAPASAPMWHARLGAIAASPQHAFGRLEVDVAPQLVPLPKRAQVVFAIDTSYSATAELVDTELATVGAYLSHVPDAEVELVTYQREARRVFGTFVAGKDVPAAIAAARAAGKLALGNGSALDAAARLAATLLADRRGPRRLVIATDHLLRSSLSDAQAIASLKQLAPDVVVHVVVPQRAPDDRVTLARVDGDPLAPLATAHHGIFTELAGVVGARAKDLGPVALELVRPTRIERLAITGGYSADPVLREGEGLRLHVGAKTAPARVALRGVLWSDPVKLDVATTPAFSRTTAALVFGEDEYHDLSHAEQLVVAFAGRAVSPVTSYVAAEPGTRPSSIGFAQDTLGLGGMGTMGHGAGGGGRADRHPPDLRALIDVRACVAQHHPASGWRVHLDVETTRDEIVDVATPETSPLARCLAETTWRVRLTSAFDREREQFSLDLHD